MVRILKGLMQQKGLGKGIQCHLFCGGVQKEVRQQIVQQLGYTIEELPFKYLGVLLSSKKLNTIQWYPLIDKIMARINSWTAKKLSYAGRAQLVKIVLFGVQAYWAQLFIITTKIIKLIEGLCRSYLWAG